MLVTRKKPEPHDRPSRRPPHRRWPGPLPLLGRRCPDRALHRARSRRSRSSPTSTGTPVCSAASTSTVTPEDRERAHLLHGFGGSPIGNSRVKLTNVKDCVKRGLVAEGQDPLHVAAEQLTADGVDVLHTIGGDDTNTTAADLAAYLHEQRLRADRRRPAEDDRQRRRADPAVAGRVDGRRAGRALRPQHHRRALLQPADAHRPRGHGPPLRVADGRDRGEVPRVARRPGVLRLRRQHPAVAGTSTASTSPSSTSTSRPRPSASRRSWTRPAASTSSCPRAPASRRSSRRCWPAARSRKRDAFGHVKLDTDQPGRVVRQAVRRHGRRREDAWCRRAATSPAPRPPTPRTWP